MSLAVEPPEIATALDVVDVHTQLSTKKVPSRESSSSPTPNKAGVFTIGGTGSSSDDGESLALGKNPFLDPKVAEYWRGVYDNANYECRHVFEPLLTWSEEEERKLVRKLDWHVCLWACVMFFGLQVDRGNLVQAVSDDMLPDLGLTTNGKYGFFFFFLSFFFLFEPPPSHKALIS